eukprot:g26593.t1
MAALFGNGIVMDAFSVAYRIPNLARRLFGEGALTAAFLPVFMREDKEAGRDSAWQLATSVLTALAVVLCGLVLLGEILLWVLYQFGGFSSDTQLLITLTSLMLPYLLLICLAAQVSAVLHALGHFTWPALLPVILNVVWIAGLWTVIPGLADPESQIYAVAGCILIGGSLQCVAPMPKLFQLGYRYRLVWSESKSAVREIGRAMLPIVLGLSITQINTLADSLIAWSFSAPADTVSPELLFGRVAYPLEAGTASALYFGQRMYQFPLGVFGAALGTVLFPLLARHAQNQRLESVRDTLTTGLKLVICVGLPASVGLMLIATPLTVLMFQHGAFDADATRKTSTMIVAYGSAVWAYCGLLIVHRAYYAIGDRITPLRIGTVAVAANLIMNLTLIWFVGGEHAMRLQHLLASLLILPAVSIVANADGKSVESTSPAYRGLILAIAANDLKAVQKAIDQQPKLINVVDDETHFTPLHYAVYRSRLAIAKYLVGKKANLNIRSKDGYTPLLLACLLKNSLMVKLFVEAKANLDLTESENGFAALHYAVSTKNAKLAKLLLDHKAKVDVRSSDHATPLHLACRTSQIKLVQLLLDHKADPNAAIKTKKMTPLHYAASSGSTDIAKLLIKHKAAVDQQTSEGVTPLHFAVMFKHHTLAEHLISKGADVNVADKDNQFRPLHYAVATKNEKLALALLDKGAKVDVASKTKSTPLHFACREGMQTIVKRLIKAGADVNAADGKKYTPLHFAVEANSTKILADLLAAKAAINAKSATGQTPLHWAAWNGYAKAAELLLKHKADTALLDETSQTALHLAAWQGNTEVARLLIAHKADVNSKPKGDTPLHLAARRGATEVVKLLLEQKADASVLDEDGGTPLHRAAERDHLKTAAALLTANPKLVAASSKDGSTALHLAVVHNLEAMVKLLLKHKAPVDVKDKKGKTPIDLAAGNQKILTLLKTQ